MQDNTSPTASTYAIIITGTIAATGDGIIGTYQYWYGTNITYTNPAVGLSVYTGNAVTGTIVNSSTTAVALLFSGPGLDLANSGAVRGGAGE